MIPAAFRELRTVRALSIGAVVLTLSAWILLKFKLEEHIFYLVDHPLTAIGALMLGAAGAALLRWRKPFGRTSLRWGWFAFAGCAIIIAAAEDQIQGYGYRAVWDAVYCGSYTLGAIFLFGVPIA